MTDQAVTYALQFTEKMRGWFSFGVSDYQQGLVQGRSADNALMFRLTISTEDVSRFVADSGHGATAIGYVQAESLGGQRPLEQGVFHLFVDDSPTRKRMLYRLFFSDSVGRALTLSGFKDIHPNPLRDLWPETSTLYTRILDGHVPEGGDDAASVVGSGILRIKPADFAWQLSTFRVHGGDLRGRLEAFGEFGRLFGGELWDVFNPLALVRSRSRSSSTGR